MHDAVPAIAAAGVSPIVRIPDMQGWMVKREDYNHVGLNMNAIANVMR